MKRILALLTVITVSSALFTACSSAKEDETDAEIKYETGDYFDIRNEDEAIYAEAAVPDKETALGIAKAVFNGMEKSEEAREYVPQAVYYDDDDGVWTVSFGKESDEQLCGGDCNIAIQKSDGKVMKIWFGE